VRACAVRCTAKVQRGKTNGQTAISLRAAGTAGLTRACLEAVGQFLRQGHRRTNMGTSAMPLGAITVNVVTFAVNVGTSAPIVGTSAVIVGTSAAIVGTSTAIVGTFAVIVVTSTAIVGTLAVIVGTSTVIVVTSTVIVGTFDAIVVTSTAIVGTSDVIVTTSAAIVGTFDMAAGNIAAGADLAPGSIRVSGRNGRTTSVSARVHMDVSRPVHGNSPTTGAVTRKVAFVSPVDEVNMMHDRYLPYPYRSITELSFCDC
jgi:hypothetical protein